MSAISTVAAALESALDLYLKADANALERCGALEGSCIALRLTGLDQTFYFLPDAAGIKVLTHYEGPVDTILTGTPLGFARLAVDNREDALFQGAVQIEGDTETGQRFQALLGSVDLDWEEQLSKLTGDVLAHQAGTLVRRARRFAADTGETLTRDLGEYLQEEARLLPGRIEIGYFLSDVDALRTDVDRLEARIQRLLNATADTQA